MVLLKVKDHDSNLVNIYYLVPIILISITHIQ
jgi:hypothetical protein